MRRLHFHHADEIWARHAELAAGVLCVDAVSPRMQAGDAIAAHLATARARLAAAPEGDWPEIQAWRRAFARMGLKPTQVRCAAEALLRRLRKEGDLPRLHPLVDLCNAVSAAHGIPVAVFDRSRVAAPMEVRAARGDEVFLGFSGEVERPEPGEIIFADADGRAHARRWAHRQSAWSAVQGDTAAVLIVAEALHPCASDDVAAAVQTLAHEALACGLALGNSAVLTAASRRFAC